MTHTSGRTAFLVTSYPGQPGVAELERQAAAGLRPRRAYVELARLLGADVIDSHYITRSSGSARLTRAVARRIGIPAAQVCEAFLRRRRYRVTCAWADRLGVPLALLFKLTSVRHPVILVSDWLSRPKKAILVRHLKAHSNLRAIINSSSVQREIAATRLHVPRHKLHLVPLPVDERFWHPDARPTEDLILAVGMEARDYSTFLEAVQGIDVNVHIAVGTIVFSQGVEGADPAAAGSDASPFPFLRRTFGYKFYSGWVNELFKGGMPPNIHVTQQLTPVELRDLYARARFVVIPLQDVNSDCGMSSITEAMAMGKAIVVTRSRGQIDVVEEGKQGLYVKPYDPTALRSAIDYLLCHPEEAERMGQAGRLLVEQQHAMDAHVRRLATLLAEAVDGPENGTIGKSSKEPV